MDIRESDEAFVFTAELAGLDKEDVEDTLGVVLKYREDVDLVLRRGVEQLVGE